jgi:RNA polymerase sigma-70 factor (ECF subfamily)
MMDDRGAASWNGRYEAIYRFVRRRTPSSEEAEDVTQEVFASAIAALAEARLTTDVPPLSWLYTVARRRLIDRLRVAPPRRGVSLDGDIADQEHSYGPALVEPLLEGLRELSEAQRRVIVLKLFEGRSFAEIAAAVDASEEACRMRFSRGLAALRESLTTKGVAP